MTKDNLKNETANSTNTVLGEVKTNEAVDWTKPDADGNITIPDELDALFNKIGMQMRFHTISGKNELQTVVDMVWIADQFFKKKYGIGA